MSEPTALLAPPPQVAHVPKVVQAREVVRHPPVTASAVSGAGGSGGGGNSAMACANLGAGAGMGAAPGAAVAAGMGIGVGPGMALNLCSQAALHVVPCRVEGQELPPPYPAPNWGGAYGGGGGAGVAPTGFGHSPGGLPPASTAAAATAAIAVASPAPNAQCGCAPFSTSASARRAGPTTAGSSLPVGTLLTHLPNMAGTWHSRRSVSWRSSWWGTVPTRLRSQPQSRPRTRPASE
jgi:hypothetical protein